ncbi:helix-turn-helix transcriptional regulator [Klebsiella pneumoniae]|uniref:helix-turn-helix domain-containing protein n=1 Tax=Klebsiella pneumoniae TaxID=573 RepID=UPI0025501892|nr:helix-turn-helix transcriptional regulator [Klebsiella pneumoniae]MDK6532474.1 helix-turn-helix transcriptional regulator [Klebsiella pneumoniae]
MGNKYTVPLNVGAIRESCFRPAGKWTPPTGEELRYLLENVLNLSQEGLARYVGVNGRTVRRWVTGESDIAYSVWCVLCIDAGLPPIWK